MKELETDSLNKMFNERDKKKLFELVEELSAEEGLENIKKGDKSSYEREKEELKKYFDEDKKAKKIKNGKKAFFIALYTTVLIGASSFATKEIKEKSQENEGKNYLTENFDEHASDLYLWGNDYQNGYTFNKGKEYVSYEEAINLLDGVAEECGYNDAQTYIVINDLYNSQVAKDVVGKDNIPSYKEINEEKMNAYYQKKLEYKHN